MAHALTCLIHDVDGPCDCGYEEFLEECIADENREEEDAIAFQEEFG
jgi:hypothetical protein